MVHILLEYMTGAFTTPSAMFLSVMVMKPVIHTLLSEVVKGALAHTP